MKEADEESGAGKYDSLGFFDDFDGENPRENDCFGIAFFFSTENYRSKRSTLSEIDQDYLSQTTPSPSLS